MTRAIYEVEGGMSNIPFKNDNGRLYSFLEFFYEVDDKIIQLLSISTFTGDPSPFRQFRKQLLNSETLEPLISPTIITEDEYYDVLLSFPPKRVLTEIAYREFTKEANYTLSIEQETDMGFFEIHTFDDRPLESCDAMVVPKRFRNFHNEGNRTPYRSLGAAFWGSAKVA